MSDARPVAGISRFDSPVSRIIATALLFGVLAFGSVLLTQDGARVAAVWPASAVALAMVLRAPVGHWPAYLLAVGAANMLANLAVGDTLLGALLLSICNALEIATAAVLVRRTVPGPFYAMNAAGLAKLCVFAGVVAPVLPALIGAAVVSAQGGGDFALVWRVWYVADALGMVLLAPLLMTVSRDSAARFWAYADRGEALATLVGAAAVAVLVFSVSRLPLMFLVFPAFLVAAFRLGIAGSALATVLVSLIGIVMTWLGYGPFVIVHGLSQADRVLLLQAYLAVAALSTVPVAALLRDRNALQGRLQQQLSALQASNALLEAQTAQLVDLAGRLAEARDQAVDKNRMLELAEEYGRVGHWRIDIGQSTLTWSDEVYRITGLDPAAYAPSLENGAGPVHPDDRATLEQAVNHAIATGSGYEVQVRLVRPDGAVRHVILRGIPQLDEAGRPTAIFGVVVDMTEQKQAEEALQSATLAAERATRAKSEFLSSMSHELRTPLNAVIGFAQLLLNNPREHLSERQREHLGYIQRGGEQLLTLIQDVLDLSKVEAGYARVSIEDVDGAAVLDAVAASLEPLARRFQVRLEMDAPSGGLAVRADRDRLLQILTNLASNGIKYNREHGAVRLSAAAGEAGWVRFAVADTGRGIPAECQHELFQPFNRLGAENGAVEGTGIGLVICRQLAELMGGRIGFESAEGAGSRFWVDLPTAEPARDSAERPAEARRAA